MTRVGIIGAGTVTELYHAPVLAGLRHVAVSWLCDHDQSRARRLARLCHAERVFTRVEDCPDVDIVLVAIPVGVRTPALDRAFRARWHILCEKPFAVSRSEHEAIVARARASGVEVGVGLMRRYYRGTVLARRLVESGALGPVRQVQASEGISMHATRASCGIRRWRCGRL